MFRSRLAVAAAFAVAGLVAVMGVAVAQTVTHTAEVRIVAQRLDDGRVEFGLQQREGDGWGERILPQRRYFPTTSEGRWLSSSPITIDVPAPATTAPPVSSTTPEATPAPTPSAQQQELPSRSWNDAGWGVTRTSGGHDTWVAGDYPSGNILLYLSCLSLDLGTRVLPYSSVSYDGYDFDPSRRVSYRFDGGAVVSESWSANYVSGGRSAVTPSVRFLEDLVNADAVTLQIGIATDTLQVTGAGAVMDDLGCFP